MATKNLSDFSVEELPSAEGLRFGIAVSEWNSEVTSALLEGCRQTLLSAGAAESDVCVCRVPGSFELINAANRMLETEEFDAVIVLGCVIKGETPHFDYICQGVTQGIALLNAEQPIPVIYGLLTCLSQQQALDRAGGRLGNKGDECAATAIRMVALNLVS